MAKNRCPVCGAGHKDPPHQCRLCGAVMDGTVEANNAVNLRARPVTKKKGSGGVVVFGVITVAVILVAAIALGFTTGDLSAGKIRDKIPFLRTNNDGWVEVDDPDGGFTVQMPSSRETVTASFAPAQNGRLTGWAAPISTDTGLLVLYGQVTPQDDESPQGTLNRMVDTDIAETTADASQTGHAVSVGKRTDTDFRGYPAVVYEISGVNGINDQYAYQKSLMFLKGDELYVINSTSIYRDHPQFDRLASSFQFTA